MKNIDAFQVYLMARMRNAMGVAAGLERLGVNASQVAASEEMITQAGLFYETEESVCTVNAYCRFLGKPLRITQPEGTTGCKTLVYVLPLWANLELELTFKNELFDGHIRFVRAGAPKARRLQPAGLVAWDVVEDDLTVSCSEIITVDGFATMSDYCCTFYDSGGEDYYLAFDFGLLQEALPWADLGIDKKQAAWPGTPII